MIRLSPVAVGCLLLACTAHGVDGSDDGLLVESPDESAGGPPITEGAGASDEGVEYFDLDVMLRDHLRTAPPAVRRKAARACARGYEAARKHLAADTLGIPTSGYRDGCSRAFDETVYRELGVVRFPIAGCMVDIEDMEFERCYVERMGPEIARRVPDLDERQKAIYTRVCRPRGDARNDHVRRSSR